MPARKPLPKTGKAKKPVAAKSMPKKSVPVRKPVAAKARPAAKAPPAVTATSTASVAVRSPHRSVPLKKPAVVKDLDTKPAVTAPPVRPDSRQPAAVARNTTSQDNAEDGESGDNSLLAGPRNVQPYTPKRGEQYMSKEQLDHFRQILLNWKQDLMMEVDRTVSHMKDEAANFPDPNDRATQEEEFSLELRTRDRERKLIRKIEEAIKRIDDGSYGYCLETGEHIGIKRLEARPVATLSIEAQERRERREKQYGDRDDRYR
ncbi:MAG: RNA polymerase-binding protein DksA [Pseudomonadota bacterium]